MASLHVTKGVNSDKPMEISLDGDRFVLGRNPDCDIVIPVTSVSREHAEILRVNGKYFIEDKKSRNNTYVNNQPIQARTPLKNNDKIRICDFLATFVEAPLQEEAEEEDDVPESDASSTVEAMLVQNSSMLLETQPAEKLRHLLEISSNLSKTLELTPLLPKIVDTLFQIFRQADRGFLIQAEEAGTGPLKLMPRVVKTRRAVDEANARFSKSIVRRCLETGQALLSDDAQKDNRVQLSQSVVDFRIRSVMCVPLCGASGKPFGVIQLDTQDRSKKFSEEDLKLLWCVANQAAIAMENARLYEDAVKRERLKRDLELAQQIQLSFLPKSVPVVQGYQFGAYYRAAQAVGGDYYGFIPLPDGRLALAVGDVAGKGVPASLMMAKLSSETRYCLYIESDPAAAVSKLNDLLNEFASEADRFVTLALLVLDPTRHTVTMVSAGHGSPLLYRAGNPGLEEVVSNDVTGVPLGIMEGYPFEACQRVLQPGDCLLIFTDGVTDMLDTNEKQFRKEGIIKVAEGAGQVTPQQMVDRIARAVQAHAAGRDPFDDVTLVAVGRDS
jgi:serine phosphatase RsbU (regulator of sigma subunit)/pSer/pThr/pTyr-binding forkhead associated (FHA) protein